MTMETSQAGAEAPAKGAPASSDKVESQQASRIQEFFASITEAEAPELRKHIRSLLEPDFQALDKKHQKRYADAERRARDAEQAMQDLSDQDVVDRYRQDQGSLAKAKERLQKKGMPAYMIRNARTHEDLWEAEDDWQKHRGQGADGLPDGADPEDAAFLERLKRLGVPLNGQGSEQGQTPRGRITPGGGIAPIEKDPFSVAFDPKGAHVKGLMKAYPAVKGG